MQAVYSNAFLNLAATAAKDGDEGLFQPRSPLLAAPCYIRADWKHNSLQILNGVYRLYNDDMLSITQFVDKAPLNSRGWVFQERYLSRRIIHFCDGRLFWECCGSILCEVEPETDTSRPGQVNDRFPSALKSFKFDIPSRSKNVADAYES
jgi:hypothetical protein